MSGWKIFTVRCGGTRPTTVAEQAGPTLLVFPANAQGEELAAAIAVATGATVLGRIASVRRDGSTLSVTRASHGGRMAIQLCVSPCLAVATANDLAEADGEMALGQPSDLSLARQPLTDEQVSLESAQAVIGGGRGLDPEAFVQLERIAAALGGAVSASLPAVDLGLAPVARQVGQSGKFVNPLVYFAAGMSGTPQHFAGVGARARIIAVNSDGDAPIFGFAEAGAVADARELLPLLADALEHKKQAACPDVRSHADDHTHPHDRFAAQGNSRLPLPELSENDR